MPLGVLLHESEGLAGLIDLLAVEQAAAAAPDPPRLRVASSELRELAWMIARLHSEANALQQRVPSGHIQEAKSFLQSLRAKLEFALVGASEEGEVILAQLRREQAKAHSYSTMAMLIDCYGRLSETYCSDLLQIGISGDFAEQARGHAARVRGHTHEVRWGERAGQRRELCVLRDDLVSLLLQEMTLQKGIIRFVFRERPEVLAKVGSPFHRARNRKQKRGERPRALTRDEMSITDWLSPTDIRPILQAEN